MDRWDVVVAGAGPAGLSLASACAAAGLSTLCVAPDAEAPWTNNFGTWVDEVEPLGLGRVFDRVWQHTIVTFEPGRARDLERPYGRVDGAALREVLLARGGKKLCLRTAAVLSVSHDARGSTLELVGGERISTRIVVDATGFGGRLLERSDEKPDAFQIAYGVMARVKTHPFPLDTMWFMDFRDEHLAAAERKEPPTFLYAMPFASDLVFIEETSLVSRPALPMETCKARLQKRCAALGIDIVGVDWEERCVIPMNCPVPRLDQRVVGFGAAAGLVHPGTGYSVSLSLSLAPKVAHALAVGLSRGDAVDTVARAAWRTVWTRGRLRMRALQLAGMAMFCRANAWALRRFLATFFRAPSAFWQGYLSARRTPAELGASLLTRG